MSTPFSVAQALKESFATLESAISYSEKIVRNARSINPELSAEYFEAASLLKEELKGK